MSTDRQEAINLTTIEFLLSAAGRQAAAELSAVDWDEGQLLSQLERLRRRYTAEQAGALIALAQLRRQAQAKFPHAAQMFFSAAALEQATAAPIAAHHAAWLDAHAPPGPVLDLGCGIGGDTLALAQVREVIAYEVDPLRLRLAQANIEAMGLAERVRFVHADWTDALAAGSLPAAAAAFADPARRQGEKRVFHLAGLQPPMDRLLALQEQVPALGVKVMPGVADAEVPAQCGVEFISHAGVCKEAVLWFGPLLGDAAPGARWASVYCHDTGSCDDEISCDGDWMRIYARGHAPPLGPLAPGMTLHEPDPAVIRAGAFAELCAALAAHLFAPDIAYLVSDTSRSHPLVQSFHILEIHPFSLKRLQARVQALGFGRLELKKRGAPFAPESLRKRIRPAQGDRAGVVIFTRRGDEHLLLLATRLAA